MKKLLFAALALMALAACSKDAIQEQPEQTVNVTFNVQADGWSVSVEPMRTRALTSDGKEMTDIWVLDYRDGVLQQQLHQSSTDADFAQPTLPLTVGQHHVYFIASRGQSPVLSTDAHTLTFGKVLDTFYRDFSIDVTATTNGSQAITLERVVTKLRLTFTDAIPTTAKQFRVTPSTWYYSLDYLTGQPATAATSQTIFVDIPSSALGSTGEYLNVFGFSSSTEWTTDITFDCIDASNNILGTATIAAAQFKRNRVSDYTGPLFTGGGQMTLSLNTAWDDPLTGTW